MLNNYSPDHIARFWAYVTKAGDEDCWIWTGPCQGDGYGQFTRAHILAHRMSYELAYGPIPDGLCVLHNCPTGDNPSCVNPAHLWLGSKGDNNRDRAAKGRTAKGEQNGTHTHPERLARGEHHGSRTHPERLRRGDNHPSKLHPSYLPRGENHYLTHLTAADIIAIRAVPKKYGTGRALARQYGVTDAAIGLIRSGKNWSHIGTLRGDDSA